MRRQNGRDRSAATDPHVRIFMAPRPPPRYSPLPLIQRGQQGRQEPAPRSVALTRAPAPEHGRVPCRGARHHSAAFRRFLPRRNPVGIACAQLSVEALEPTISAVISALVQLTRFRKARRVEDRYTDRLFWVGLARVWTGWRQSLVIVTPATVLRWQRRRFREHSIAPSSQTSVMGS